MHAPRNQPTRRALLRRAAGGFGSLALAGMLAEAEAATAGPRPSLDPLAPKPPHFRPRAQRVIFLYMTGGVSHVESFDPKPRLLADGGKTVKVDNFQGKRGEFTMYLKPPQFAFRPG